MLFRRTDPLRYRGPPISYCERRSLKNTDIVAAWHPRPASDAKDRKEASNVDGVAVQLPTKEEGQAEKKRGE